MKFKNEIEVFSHFYACIDKINDFCPEIKPHKNKNLRIRYYNL